MLGTGNPAYWWSAALITRDFKQMLKSMRFCLVLLILGGCGGNNEVPGSGCAVDGECPLHQLCDLVQHACRSGCLDDGECGGARCNAHGRCVMSDAGTIPDDLGSVDADVDQGEPPDLLSGDDASDLASCPGVCPDTALEPNNSSGAATVETLGGATLSNLAVCPANDEDWYTVTAAAAGSVHVVLTRGPCGAALRADWYSQGGTVTIGTSTATATGWEATATVKAGQVRFLRVIADHPGDQNSYSLALSLQ